jgi:hypothetical protein
MLHISYAESRITAIIESSGCRPKPSLPLLALQHLYHRLSRFCIISSTFNTTPRILHGSISDSQTQLHTSPGVHQELERWQTLNPNLHEHGNCDSAAFGCEILWIFPWSAMESLSPVVSRTQGPPACDDHITQRRRGCLQVKLDLVSAYREIEPGSQEHRTEYREGWRMHAAVRRTRLLNENGRFTPFA